MNNLKIRTTVLLTLLSLILCSIPFANAYQYPGYEKWKDYTDTYSQEDALKMGEKLGIKWIPEGDSYKAEGKDFYAQDLAKGMNVETEHAKRAKITKVISNELKTCKVALAHLNEFPTYYEELEQMEVAADAYWESDHPLPITSTPNLDPDKTFTEEEATAVGEQLGIKWDQFDKEQFRAGMDIELEHGSVDPITDLTGDDPVLTGTIVLGHLVEFPDYYNRLYEMEHQLENP